MGCNNLGIGANDWRRILTYVLRDNLSALGGKRLARDNTTIV